MLHKTKVRIIFWGSLIIGLALCIGGIWVEPLLIPGGILLAGALGMYQSAYAVSQDNLAESQMQDHMAHHLDMVTNREIEVTQNVGLFFVYRPRSDSELTDSVPERPRAPSPRLTLV